jgi:microcystin-dependent protein
MSEPFIGEIRSFGFNFAPLGWAQCNGQLLSIAQNDALFAVIGTTYGGDGQTTFALPNLQGQVPMHWGTGPGLNTTIGEVQGQSSVTLAVNQIPQHSHTLFSAVIMSGQAAERSAKPSGTSFLSQNTPGEASWQKPPATTDTSFSPRAISITGGSQPHENMQPYLVLNFCMATEGIFPQRT